MLVWISGPAGLEAHQQCQCGFCQTSQRLTRLGSMLNWLEQSAEEGACPAILSDDNGHWSVSFEGVQSMPDGEGPQDTDTSFFVPAGKWYTSVIEALIAAQRWVEET